MGSARWKRRLLGVLVGVVVGLGGVGGQPAAYADGGRHARDQRCGDCYERPARDDCYRERPCPEDDRARRCCYERPARDDCYQERPCAKDDCDDRDEKDGYEKGGGDKKGDKKGDEKGGGDKKEDEKDGYEKGGGDKKGDEKDGRDEKGSRLHRLLRGIFD